MNWRLESLSDWIRDARKYKILLVVVEGWAVVTSFSMSYPESPNFDPPKNVPNTNIMQIIRNKPINANL